MMEFAATSRPPKGMKGRAPQPPPQPAPRRILTATKNCKVVQSEQNPRDMKENVLPGIVDLLVTLPNGAEKSIQVNESKAVMDLLIDLCSQYHLNPTHHTLELQSRETRKPLGYKPNTAVGILDVDKVLIKQKVIEDKPRRPRPVVPEKTVRLIVNFLRTQKAVLRVSPLVPLQELLPIICEKCDFKLEHLVLLKDCIKREKMDLSKSLNDLETRELYALDTSRELSQSALTITDMNEKEDKGLLGFLKIGRKKTKSCSTTPSTPTVNARSATLNPSLSASNISRISQVMDIKKRRAPPPPSAPPEHTDVKHVADSAHEIGAESVNSWQKKRRAPAPPPTQNKLERTEFDRSNTIGVAGCQVPLKPPRGTLSISDKPRNPPQLMIPPPPPEYPPSADNENVSQPGMSDFTHVVPDVPEHGESIPESDLGSDQDGGVGDNIMEIESRDGEETASVKSSDSFQQSCSNYTSALDDEMLKSDDDATVIAQTTMFSSPTGSLRLSNKTDADEILEASDKIFGTVEKRAWSNGARYTEDAGHSFGNKTIRFETASHAESNWKEEGKVSIAAQVNLSLAELDAELPAMQEELASKKSSTLSERTVDEQETVPVTIIDEVPWTCQEKVEEVLLKEVPKPSKVKGLAITDRNGGTNSKVTTGICITNIYERSPSYMSSSTSHPSNVVDCIDVSREPIKKTQEHLKTEVVQDEMKPGESKLKMTFPATELACDMQIRGNVGKNMRSAAPAKIDTVVLEERNCQSKHGRQVERYSATTHIREHIHTSDRRLITANKITNDCVPKVGMRTFTVIPLKPTVKPQQREHLSRDTFAIKIDDQGNLMHAKSNERISKETASKSLATDKESLVGRAKAFWNVKSTDKNNLQYANTAKIGTINKSECTAAKLQQQGPEKQSTILFPTSIAVTAQVAAASTKGKNYSQSTEEKPFVADVPSNVKMTSMPVNSQPKINNFIRPYRRSSSQDVASAICRYTGLQATKTEARNKSFGQFRNGFERRSDDTNKFSSVEEKSSPKSSKMRSPLNTEFAHNSSCNTEDVTKVLNKLNVLPQESIDTDDVLNQNCLIKNASDQTNAFNKITFQKQPSQIILKESISTNEQISTAKSLIPQSTFQSASVKGVISSSPNDQIVDMTKTFTFTPYSSFSVSVKTHSTEARQSDCISDNISALNLPTTSVARTEIASTEESENSQSFNLNRFNIKPNSSIFGPVKKFKPIIPKPVPKDECRHSTLMKAIQSGENKERLRKTSDKMMDSNMRQSSIIAIENEHSALLASIRAHSGLSKLTKTTSTASSEIQNTNNVVSSASAREYSQSESQYLASPPPPPAEFTKSEKFSTKSVVNEEDARTALLKAIQSGTGAARLRKVSIPSNTIQINGRTSSVQMSKCWTPYISS
ncbi:protein cordon-bleu isoform X3 [Amblyraja radiata]|uniref:protein cordon-bleu isoform X3 n=1 Tax=Amblyraja radiata TaxID=386614 RepID=UPI00140275A0|nr:protein cordon-bleu isoform X3 [Amblyraja radiata]XP_032905933.1 protein cordon-bleu isoform X3 [Amblyraja radiata]